MTTVSPISSPAAIDLRLARWCAAILVLADGGLAAVGAAACGFVVPSIS